MMGNGINGDEGVMNYGPYFMQKRVVLPTKVPTCHIAQNEKR